MRNLIKILSMITVICVVCAVLVSAFAASDRSGGSGTYVIGDIDGDGSVTILDATVGQRVLAHMVEDPDGSRAMRGDIDGDGSLTSLDITLILRYMASMRVDYPIDEEKPLPTEAPTETVKPTIWDQYELPLV